MQHCNTAKTVAIDNIHTYKKLKVNGRI